MYAAQAIDLDVQTSVQTLSKKTSRIIREKVAKLEEDRLLKPDIDAMVALVKSQAFNVNLLTKWETS